MEKKVSIIQQLIPILESVIKGQQSLLVVSEDVDSKALAMLVVNKLRAGIKVCAVKVYSLTVMTTLLVHELTFITANPNFSCTAPCQKSLSINIPSMRHHQYNIVSM